MTARPEASIPKPHVRLLDHEQIAWHVDFGNGATAQFWWAPNPESNAYPPGVFRWTIRLDSSAQGKFGWSCQRCWTVSERGWSSTSEIAFAVVWCRVAADRFRPDPIELADDFELRRLAERAEKGTAKESTEIFRGLLERRTGFRWSVRKARHSDKITICMAPKRCRDGKVMRPRDVALLAAVLGDGDLVPNRGITIGEQRGDRAAAIYKIAGHPRREAGVRSEVA